MEDLKKTLSALEKKYGAGVVRKGGLAEIQKVPTGIISIDRLLEGGFPRGRWSMLFGQKSTCKTSLCKHMVGVMQGLKEEVLVIDAEHTWDPNYAAQLGMDSDKCYYNRPTTVEEMGTIVNDFAPHCGLIVVDSITGVSAAAELDRDLEQETMALIPRKLSQFFRMTNPVVGKSNCVVLLVNQVRVNMSGMYAFDDYPGGNALGHYAAAIIHTARGKKADNPQKEINGKKQDVGFVVNLKLEKTKVSSTENQKATLNFYHNVPHFNVYDDAFKVGVIEGIINRAGAWYEYEDIKTCGSDAFIAALTDNKKTYVKLQKELMG